MATHFGDLLIDAIRQKGNPCVVGLDFHETGLPGFVLDRLAAQRTASNYRSTMIEYFHLVIDAVAPIVPAVKPQSALIEKFKSIGADVFDDIVKHAHAAGLVVIADAKRGDIASSAAGYAETFIGEDSTLDFVGYGADAVTVNAYLGGDTLEPYLQLCRRAARGIFVLVKTSNKGSVETQDVLLKNTGQPVFTLYANMVRELGRSMMGTSGYSSVGAVVGATFPGHARSLRELMPNAIILVPGYGAQGGSAQDAALYFNKDGYGAIVNASRSITHSFGGGDVSEKTYAASVRQNAEQMALEIGKALRLRMSS